MDMLYQYKKFISIISQKLFEVKTIQSIISSNIGTDISAHTEINNKTEKTENILIQNLSIGKVVREDTIIVQILLHV